MSMINSWKLLSENPQPPRPPPSPCAPEKIHSPLHIHKVQVSPFFANIETFTGPPAERGEDNMSGYGQTCLVLPKSVPNRESAWSQEWVEP